MKGKLKTITIKRLFEIIRRIRIPYSGGYCLRVDDLKKEIEKEKKGPHTPKEKKDG